MNKFIEYLYFMNSQIPLLVLMTIIFIWLSEMNYVYGLIILFYALVFFVPIFHFFFILKNSNSENNFKISKIEQKNMGFKKYLISLLFLAITIIRITNPSLLNIDFINLLIGNLLFLNILLLVILSVWYFFTNYSYEYWVFENFILINVLKFKIFEIENSHGNKIHLLTKKNPKKHDIIRNHKHLFGGIYYHKNGKV